MRTLIAANWKMNKLPCEATEWAAGLKENLEHSPLPATTELVICAPYTHLQNLSTAFAVTAVAVGAQDVSRHDAGAFTGEVSAAMLQDIGVSYVIIGHSERRDYHQESDALINAKVKQVLGQQLRPILCVGESEAQREAGEAQAVVVRQLEANLDGVTFDHAEDMVIAYEPIWAIGTGKTATADDAQEMSAQIRQVFERLYPQFAAEMRILYGGSMKADNAAELLGKADINGGLIGGASLKIDDYLAIARAA